MTKEEIAQELIERYARFANMVDALGESFDKAPEGKWTPGQQLEHLGKSVKPIAQGLRLPYFLLKWKFWTANRPSRTYDEVVAKYLNKIPKGYIPGKQYLPAPVSIEKKSDLKRGLDRSVRSIARSLNKMSEKQVDELVLPHPLIGRITLREMMYFTLYHVDHHYANVQRDQKNLS